MSNQRDLGQKFDQVRTEHNGEHRIDFWGGTVSVRVVTLHTLYIDHLYKKNIWTASNEGYDLARYFGCRWTLHPHDTFDYIFWWESDWLEPLAEDTINLAPAIALNSKHRKIVLSKRHGRKKPKRIYIKPPGTLKTDWYSIKAWENIVLLRWGITLCNFNTPFLHTNEDAYGTWIGWAYLPEDKNKHKGPPTIPLRWCGDDMQEKNFKYKSQIYIPVYYKFWWDNGNDNAIMLNSQNLKMDCTHGKVPGTILHINIPYWQFFNGQNMLTANHNKASTDYERDPSVYAIWWYKDWGVSTKRGNRYEPTPNDIPHSPSAVSYERQWVFLTGENLDGMAGGPQSNPTDVTADSVCTFRNVQKILAGIVAKGPFQYSAADIEKEGRVINIPLSYVFYWQWGGVGPTSVAVRDPAPNTVTGRISVVDPGKAIQTTIHPWDTHHSGILTTRKLKQLLSIPSDLELPEGVPKKSLETEEEQSQEEKDSNSQDNLQQQIQQAQENQLKQLLSSVYDRVKHGELERKRFLKKLKKLWDLEKK